MAGYSRQSLDLLRSKVDLVELLSSHLKMQKSGGYYKACCPFHQEKSPSFMVQRGDMHYHCFGCGAHGDAITFLTEHLKVTFKEAVEMLAEKFHVPLEKTQDASSDFSVQELKGALAKIHRFYQGYLLLSDEGRSALQYLFDRGFTLDFIHRFGIGLAPSSQALFLQAASELHISLDILEKVGVIKMIDGKQVRAYFTDRIVIPIFDVFGNPIAFSCRKMKEETFGPKYINSPETVLFKKSQLLFGLFFSRKKIAKEQKALVVEGQFDALRLIDAGFDITVAGQGTAFGEAHVKELLHLGVKNVYLAFDGDDAGQEAAMKVGQLFQKEGVEVWVITLEKGKDPDLIIREMGPSHFDQLLRTAHDYLSFLAHYLSMRGNPNSPAGKNEIVRTMMESIKQWEHPLMVHEGIKKVSKLLQVPLALLDPHAIPDPEVEITQKASLLYADVDPIKVLEHDLLRWMLLIDPHDTEAFNLIFSNISKEDFYIPLHRALYEEIYQNYSAGKAFSMMEFSKKNPNVELNFLLAEILQKKINLERKDELIKETMMKILERNWLAEREKIKMQIHKGGLAEGEVMELAKKFDYLKSRPPVIKVGSA
jgi:DNA primase